jgi:hypothetical protein
MAQGAIFHDNRVTVEALVRQGLNLREMTATGSAADPLELIV